MTSFKSNRVTIQPSFKVHIEEVLMLNMQREPNWFCTQTISKPNWFSMEPFFASFKERKDFFDTSTAVRNVSLSLWV